MISSEIRSNLLSGDQFSVLPFLDSEKLAIKAGASRSARRQQAKKIPRPSHKSGHFNRMKIYTRKESSSNVQDEAYPLCDSDDFSR
jgi:hypothetical protein